MIVVMPGETPVTTPVGASTDAMEVLPLLHTPPKEVSLSVADAYWQICAVPIMSAGSGSTERYFVAVAVPQLLETT